VAAFSGSPTFALGSVEGRVAMEVMDPSPAAQEAKYAFKVGSVTSSAISQLKTIFCDK
jgi:hypothetical protein